MVYIHVQDKGVKKYYSLRTTKRENGKIIARNLCTLGKDISKINIKEIKKKFPKETEKSINTLKRKINQIKYNEKYLRNQTKENKYLNKKQISEINAIINHSKNKPKTKKLQKDFYNKFILENISIDSIEKKIFNKEDIKKILQKNISPSNKPLKEIYKVINTKRTIEFLNSEKNLTVKIIERLPEKLFDRISLIKGYRKQEITEYKKIFRPSEYKRIEEDLKKLISWYNKNKTKIPPIALTTLFHHKFEKIHPFGGGNGEIGRIILNYQLSKFNHPKIIIPTNKKREYYKAMDKAYKGTKKDLLNTDMKYYKSLIDFMHNQFVSTYWKNSRV